MTRPPSGAVIVTQPSGDNGRQIAALEERGVIVHPFPVFSLVGDFQAPELASALASLQSFAAIVFPSRNAVRFFAAALAQQGRDLPSGVAIFCVGSEAAVAVGTAFGRIADVVAADEAALIPLILAETVPQDMILLPKGDMAAPDFALALTGAGRTPIVAPCYRNIRVQKPDDVDLAAMLAQSAIVSFASASAVHHFVALAEGFPIVHLRAVCIGARTAAKASEHFPTVIVAAQPTLRDLVDAVFLEACKTH